MLATIVAVAVVLTVVVVAGSSLGNNMLSLWTARDPDVERYRNVAHGAEADSADHPVDPLVEGELPATRRRRPRR